MQIPETRMGEAVRVPLFDEGDDEDGELDVEDLLKLGDEEAPPLPDT